MRIRAAMKALSMPVVSRSGLLCVSLSLVVAIVSGCSATTEQKHHGVQYPKWLIATAEPAAPAIGFVMSRVQWREGYLNAGHGSAEYVRGLLKPLDIILFSNKHRLSGHAGGGLFSHSAVYLGAEEELKALGLWTHPDVEPHHDSIRGGRLLIESAQKTGTILAPESLLRETDRLVVLRPRRIDKRRKHEAIAALFSKIGTPFDHRFRLGEGNGLFCTELIDHAMPELSLPRRILYGRQVISPDDIDRSAAAGGKNLRLITYLAGSPHGWEVMNAPALIRDLSDLG